MWVSVLTSDIASNEGILVQNVAATSREGGQPVPATPLSRWKLFPMLITASKEGEIALI